MSSYDAKTDALYYASILMSRSTEANPVKRAAQTIHLAEMLQDWLENGRKPRIDEGLLNHIYFGPPRAPDQSSQIRRGHQTPTGANGKGYYGASLRHFSEN